LPEPSASAPTIEVRVIAIRYLTETINLFELQPLGRLPLPAWTPGAHIDVHLRGALIRQYSLIGDDAPPDRYCIAVKREANGRGGSRQMHQLRVGQIIEISAPRNNFPLALTDAPNILFAGGIGITPILSMARKLERDGLQWTLHYCCPSRQTMPFRASLESMAHVRLRFDDENPGCFLDMAGELAAAPKNAHLYCCGPAPMMKAFELATAQWPPEQIHVEYFSNTVAPDTNGGFIVELARSGHEFLVPPGKTILAVLKENGLPVRSSCEEGVCGTCETLVVSGIPDHRDIILTDVEKAQNRSMMICCSGSKSDRLVLDL
jgi:ferredoxin-NADP reductase